MASRSIVGFSPLFFSSYGFFKLVHLLTVSLLTTFPRVLQHKPKLHFPCCKQDPFLKTHFDYRHLTSSASFLYLLLTLSEETTQRKHTYVTQPILSNNNKQKSPAKAQLKIFRFLFFSLFRKVCSRMWMNFYGPQLFYVVVLYIGLIFSV